jgi:hypothetical protein
MGLARLLLRFQFGGKSEESIEFGLAIVVQGKEVTGHA